MGIGNKNMISKKTHFYSPLLWKLYVKLRTRYVLFGFYEKYRDSVEEIYTKQLN